MKNRHSHRTTRARARRRAREMRLNAKSARPSCLSVAERARRRRLGKYLEQLDEFCREHFRRLVAICQFRGLNYFDAKDVTQNAFLGAMKSAERFDRRRKFKPWFWRIWSNKLNDALRQRYRCCQSLDHDEVSRVPAASETLFDRRAGGLWELFAVLAPQDIELLRSHYLDNISLPVLARRQGRSRSAIKMQLFRARQSLKEQARRMSCHSIADADEWAAKRLAVPVVLPPPQPAVPPHRPSCQVRPKNSR